MKYTFTLEGITENLSEEQLLNMLQANISDCILCLRSQEGESLILKPKVALTILSKHSVSDRISSL